jgi:ArsR family transcriptional regulator, lead/cadmium/zinc/bismuth-responsive transcriptional repressor
MIFLTPYDAVLVLGKANLPIPLIGPTDRSPSPIPKPDTVGVQNNPPQSNAHQNVPLTDDRCDVLCLDIPLAEELRRRRLSADAAEAAAAQARALSNPTRLSLAVSLRDGGELCVCDLAWISGRAQNLVSHHLRALKAAGVAESRREGKTVFYSLTDAGAELLEGVLGHKASVTS